MATNDVVIKVGGQFVFADHGTDYVGGTGNASLEITGSTDVQIDCTDLAAGGARMSVKADLTATRAAMYAVMMSIEFATAPNTGETVDLYWAPSPDASAGVGNPGAVTGADAAYTGYSSNLAASLLQLDFIGSMICTVQATTTVQIATVGIFSPADRYGSLVVFNNTSDAFFTDAVEIAVSFQPIVTEILAAV